MSSTASGFGIDRVSELQGDLEDMRLTIEESDQAVACLEAKINARRARNPLEPIPFELFSDFCRDWAEKCKMATETVRFQLRKANAELTVKRELVEEKQKMAGSESLVVDHESLVLQRKDNEQKLRDVSQTNYELMLMGGAVKRDATKEKIKLGETIKQYGLVSERCVKLEKSLGLLEEKIERTEKEIEELETMNRVLREKTARYKAPSILDVAKKIDELEQAEKELLGVVKEKIKENE